MSRAAKNSEISSIPPFNVSILTGKAQVQEFGNCQIQFNRCPVREIKGTVGVSFEMNAANYSLWLRTLKSGSGSDITKFIEDIGALTKTLYLEKGVAVGIALLDHYNYKPTD